MVWTGHGHHIPGTVLLPPETRPDRVGCAGPGGCVFCDDEIEERKAELAAQQGTS